MTVCNSVAMFEGEYGRRPKSGEEFLKYLSALGSDNPQIQKWVDALRSGEFIVRDPEKIKDEDPYITFKPKSEKIRYISLKNGKLKTANE